MLLFFFDFGNSELKIGKIDVLSKVSVKSSVWERAVHSVYVACLSSTFINLCVCFVPFSFL